MCYMTHVQSRRRSKAPAGAGKAKPRAPVPASPARLPPTRPRDVVGVRELRQNLSVYLDRVKMGEALQVSEHGRVVAVLRPVPANASRLDILVAQGLVTPATRSIRDLPPPRKAPPGTPPMSKILDELREDRF
jgi:prevent-host-death family protein